MIFSLYTKYVNLYGWSLKELDDTDFETMIDFLWYKEDEDPNVRVIGGKTYVRASGPPTWL